MSNQSGYPEQNYGSVNPPQEENPFNTNVENDYSSNDSGSYTPSYEQPQPPSAYSSPNFSSDAYASAAPVQNSAQSANNAYNDPYAASANDSWNNSYQNSGQQSNAYPIQTQSSDLNIKALLGLIFSFIFFPAGLILSILGFREAKAANDSTGRVLSLVGLIISGLQTVLVIAWILLFVFLIIVGGASSM